MTAPEPPTSEPASFTVFARAALAGNPSDAFGGAVLAVPVRSFAARATYRAPLSPVAAPELVAAATVAFDRERGTSTTGTVRWETSVPLQVGLAGSSAIVLAVLRALAAEHGWAAGPLELALRVETEGLGLAAGLQDRITQAHDAPMFMDFAAERYERLAPAGLPMLVAYCAEGERSGVVHSRLQERWAAEDDALRAAVGELREQAFAARLAYAAGDLAALGACMTRSTELRLSLYAPHPAHTKLFEPVRGAGLEGNFTGSGGAVVAVEPGGSPERARTAEAQLRAAGYGVVSFAA